CAAVAHVRRHRGGWAKQLTGVGTTTAFRLVRRGGDTTVSTPKKRTRTADPASQSVGLTTLADRSSLWLGSVGGQPRRCSRESLRAFQFIAGRGARAQQSDGVGGP